MYSVLVLQTIFVVIFVVIDENITIGLYAAAYFCSEIRSIASRRGIGVCARAW